MKDLIIIGGGAAGVTAAIYAARKYIDTLLITKDFTGQIGNSAWIENYPGFKKVTGLDLIKAFKEHLDVYKPEVKLFENILKIEKINNGFKVITDESSYTAKSLVIATGGVPKKLNVENEDKLLGKGISYCVTCDETAFKNKVVAVIGGGNAGVEGAVELARFCKKVYLLEYAPKLSADKISQNEVRKNKKIQIITSADVRSFQGGEYLKKIVYEDKKAGKLKNVIADGCFIEIGAVPNTGFLKGFVKLNNKGEIKVNPISLETSVKGLFAAGDATNMLGKQIVIACGHGALAMLSVSNYLQKEY